MKLINELLEEVNGLIKAKELLIKIWYETDPYYECIKPISKETHNELRKYFNFDDSE